MPHRACICSVLEVLLYADRLHLFYFRGSTIRRQKACISSVLEVLLYATQSLHLLCFRGSTVRRQVAFALFISDYSNMFVSLSRKERGKVAVKQLFVLRRISAQLSGAKADNVINEGWRVSSLLPSLRIMSNGIRGGGVVMGKREGVGRGGGGGSGGGVVKYSDLNPSSCSEAHSENRFPAVSSRLCQIYLRRWRGTLYLRAAVHRRGQRPPKGSGTNMTVEAT